MFSSSLLHLIDSNVNYVFLAQAYPKDDYPSSTKIKQRISVEDIMISGRKQLIMSGAPHDRMSLGRFWIHLYGSSIEWSQIK